MATTWLLVGGVTDTAAEVKAEVVGSSVRLAVSATPDMASPTYSAAKSPDGNGYVAFTKAGLTPGSRHYAALEVDGTIDAAWVTTFRTDAAAPGSPADFTAAFFSCAPGSGNPPSAHLVHDKIAARKCDLNFHLGDFGYPNIATNDPALYRASWKAQLTAAHPALVMKAGAFGYVWDDHDFGPDNSDRTAPGKASAAQVFREMFPSHPLVQSAGSIERAFTKGRVRFIVTDQRFYRDPYLSADDASKTMLGLAQRQWFIDEVVAARDAGLFPVWISSQVPHHGDATVPDWGSYTTERKWIWDQLAANGVTSLVVFSGDVHAMGFTRKVDYSTAGTAPVRVYVASALDPASPGAPSLAVWDAISGDRGQYATFEVIDHGTHADFTVKFWHVNAAGVEALYFSDTYTLGAPPPAAGIYRVLNGSGQRVAVVDTTGTQRYVAR